MRRIAYLFLVAISPAFARVETGALARPSRAKLGTCLRLLQPSIRRGLLALALLSSVIATMVATAPAETRPHYGGTLRIMLQSTPNTLDLPANSSSAGYWDAARALSLVGDTLVLLDPQDRPQPSLAIAWQGDTTDRHWQFTLRRGVKFHDGSTASPAAVAQILAELHSAWNVRASADALLIDTEKPAPALLAELALPRNLLLKRPIGDDANRIPIGTGPFRVAEWQPGKLLKLAANEESWAGRPFVNAVEIDFGKSLRDQAIALELDKTDWIETAPQATTGLQRHIASSPSPSSYSSSSSSLPVELLALVFTANSKMQDPRLRQALALAIDRKPIQSVLLKGAGEPAASILPNWMTGYTAVFSTQSNPEQARAVLAQSRPASPGTDYSLSYDPADPQAQLIAERIALDAREVGITLQISLSGAEDIRLMRAVLPSPDPATSLAEAARQLGLQPPSNPAAGGNSLQDLYQAERSLLTGPAVIPLLHLPLASAASARVRGWEPSRLGEFCRTGLSLADVWLADVSPAASRPESSPQAARQ